MLEKYYNDYSNYEYRALPQARMTFRRALIYTLFDSIFIGIKVAIIIGVGWLFISFFWVNMATEFAVKVCPIMK